MSVPSIQAFRRNAAGFSRRTVALTAAVAIGLAAMTFPTLAQQVSVNGYNGSPACAKFAGTDRAIRCEIEQSKMRTDAANKRGAEADKHTAKNEAILGCTQFLITGIKGGRLNHADVLTAAGGKITDDNACTVARRYGYERKAEVNSPNMN